MRDPKKRLGYRGAAEVKAHPFFQSIDWEKITIEDPVFVPSFDDAFDTSYFEPHRKRHPSLVLPAPPFLALSLPASCRGCVPGCCAGVGEGREEWVC